MLAFDLSSYVRLGYNIINTYLNFPILKNVAIAILISTKLKLQKSNKIRKIRKNAKEYEM